MDSNKSHNNRRRNDSTTGTQAIIGTSFRDMAAGLASGLSGAESIDHLELGIERIDDPDFLTFDALRIGSSDFVLHLAARFSLNLDSDGRPFEAEPARILREDRGFSVGGDNALQFLELFASRVDPTGCYAIQNAGDPNLMFVANVVRLGDFERWADLAHFGEGGP